VIKTLGETTKLIAGDAPGLDLVIYGLLLVGVVGLAPRGIVGLLTAVTRRCSRSAKLEHSNG
jgi:branched-chain amino acid transport system permease protein